MSFPFQDSFLKRKSSFDCIDCRGHSYLRNCKYSKDIQRNNISWFASRSLCQMFVYMTFQCKSSHCCHVRNIAAIVGIARPHDHHYITEQLFLEIALVKLCPQLWVSLFQESDGEEWLLTALANSKLLLLIVHDSNISNINEDNSTEV